MRRLWIGGLLIAVLAWLVWMWAGQRGKAREEPIAADSLTVGVRAVRLYFGAASGDSLVSEPRELVEVSGLHERVAALVGELDRGPRGRGVALLPAGTSVLHVYLDDRGLMTLDLSGAFRQGFRGGSTGEAWALASLARTLGANLPEVKRLQIVCAGRPIASLGGHLPLDQPLDVSDWP
ncbi:MAG: GerMN domain-containing protein [Candidatus Eisenbacteria bacterium]|uniref:GerMN domain-containing protein n=1 Tax=Eiseniibacteriota bacterium TaxID=2212470 RepID=A0A538TPB5_UNCEI|nr:MAG: GerMN domain-containing protein [Candidatus Eisenbacteria bacterium]